MKCRIAILFLAASLFFSASASAVTIKGKNLADISDIVKTVTSSDFPEVPKHSLLLYERFEGESNTVRYQPRIFTIKSDGSLRKEYVPEYDDSTSLPISPAWDVVQKMDVSISPKRFGMRRNVVYSTAGLTGNYNSRYGFSMLQSNGTEDTAQISRSGNAYTETDNRTIWDNANLTLKGMDSKDVFVVAHTNRVDTWGNLYFRFFTVFFAASLTFFPNRPRCLAASPTS